MVKDINIGTNPSSIQALKAIGTKLYFSADDGTNGNEPWMSDGTEAGTNMLLDIEASSGSSNPNEFSLTSNGVVFLASESNTGRELYVTNGTAVGTHLIVDLEPGYGNASIYELTSNGSIAYFQATDSGNGVELWKTDGTSGGTSLISDIYPGSYGSYSSHFAIIDGLLYFSANDGTHGYEPWVSDGSPSGTHLLIDAELGSSGSYPNGFTKIGTKIVFYYSSEGYGLYSFDTMTLTVENLGQYSVNSSTIADEYVAFQKFGNGLLFKGILHNGYYSYDNDLYLTDGTIEGTLQIVSSTDFTPNDFHAFSNFILFNANNPNHGYWGDELFILSQEPAPIEPAEPVAQY